MGCFFSHRWTRRFTGLLVLSASLGRVSKNDALLFVGNAVRPLLGTGMRCTMNFSSGKCSIPVGEKRHTV
jgi:hypothetical protein